jgi:hypothetical protein
MFFRYAGPCLRQRPASYLQFMRFGPIITTAILLSGAGCFAGTGPGITLGVTSTPEPGSGFLMLTGLVLLVVGVLWRRRTARAAANRAL